MAKQNQLVPDEPEKKLDSRHQVTIPVCLVTGIKVKKGRVQFIVEYNQAEMREYGITLDHISATMNDAVEVQISRVSDDLLNALQQPKVTTFRIS